MRIAGSGIFLTQEYKGTKGATVFSSRGVGGGQGLREQGGQGGQGGQICEFFGLALLVLAKYFGVGVKIYEDV